jgi:hypothetical protein
MTYDLPTLITHEHYVHKYLCHLLFWLPPNDIENLLMNKVLEKEIFLKRHKFKKTPFHASMWEGAKEILVWNCPSNDFDLWNLKQLQ